IMKIQKTLITLFLLNYLSNIYAQEPIGTILTTGNEKIEHDVNGGLTNSRSALSSDKYGELE
ncbi:MAG: hypothetical protein AAF901_12940, partial [Bacteroidota bacterium]